MKKSYIETEDVEMWEESGIVHVLFKPHIVNVGLAFSKNYVKERFKVLQETTKPVLVDVNKAKSIDKDARDYLAGEEASKYISAGALIVHSMAAKFGGNFFLTVNKPPFPTKLFTNKEKAVQWLSLFKT